MTYPIDKYHYYTAKMVNGAIKTIAVSTYAGKTVRGVAICSPEDTYDENKGKELAAARCAARIAEKRSDRAASKVLDAYMKMLDAENHYDKMCQYSDDANRAVLQTMNHVREVLESL